MFKQKVRQVLDELINSENIPKEDYLIEESSFGDFSANIALKLSRFKNYQTPMEIAKFFQANLEKNDLFETVTVTEPGFINFTINQKKTVEIIPKIIKQEDSYGVSKVNKGKKARVEFVSANPTGPLHIGNARGGPLGDVIASVLEESGYEVLREYLNNNEGNQIKELGTAIAAKAGLIAVKEEDLTYQGDYTKLLAEKVKEQIHEKGKTSEDLVVEAGRIGANLLFRDILKTCKEMGINFDLLIHESDLKKTLPKIIKELENKGVLKKKEGAIWFSPQTKFQKDFDAVVVKSDGSYTYFASDIAYHREKFSSGYDLVIDVFGSNTSGHVPKLLSFAEVENFDLSKFKVILYQFVRVKQGDQVIKMSKRAGNFVTAQEVLDEVGKDAFRFFLLSRSPNTHLDFDLELAKKQSSENPVYYVQYAHARLSSILNKAESLEGNVDYSLIKEEEELKLIKKLDKFEDLFKEICQTLEVHRLTFYALELAEAFHSFYEKHKVLGPNKELTKARIDLVRSTKIILKKTLKLLGVSAPEKM
jgi:arginyl-tRNA synthetase